MRTVIIGIVVYLAVIGVMQHFDAKVILKPGTKHRIEAVFSRCSSTMFCGKVAAIVASSAVSKSKFLLILREEGKLQNETTCHLSR